MVHSMVPPDCGVGSLLGPPRLSTPALAVPPEPPLTGGMSTPTCPAAQGVCPHDTVIAVVASPVLGVAVGALFVCPANASGAVATPLALVWGVKRLV